MKPRLFILSFTSLSTDGRVLRQIKALAPHFDVTAAGLDDDPSPLLPGIAFRFVKLTRRRSLAAKSVRLFSYLPGAIFPPADFWPWWMTTEYRQAKEALFAEPYDAMLCNDINAILLGVEGRRRRGIPFVADYHEFPGKEATERLSSRWFKDPHAERCVKRYGPLAAGSVTVNQPFADTFRREYGFEAEVVLNAPELRPLPEPVPRGDDTLHLIYHGIGGPNRNIDLMIRAVGSLHRKAVLHLMLLADEAWMIEIQRYAEETAPGKVEFHLPVAPQDISTTVSRYDVGLFVVHSCSFNNEQALPNKLFEYIHGGLAVCCTPSPALTSFIAARQNGWLMENVTSESLAHVLESITPVDLARCKQASLEARTRYHAGKETSTLVNMLLQVCGESHRTPGP